jgi:hypothetical protein
VCFSLNYTLLTHFDFYFEVDFVSYDANRKLLLELCSKKPIDHQAVKELATLTFDGRRSKMLSTEMSVDEILKDMMPLLRDTTYVCILLVGGTLGGLGRWDFGLVFELKFNSN